jgi:hypothetical protein
MGVEAYAIPGTGVMPPEKTCQVLALHNVVVVLDGTMQARQAGQRSSNGSPAKG